MMVGVKRNRTTEIETRSGSSKRKYNRFLYIILPLIHLLFPYVDDLSAIHFFTSNHFLKNTILPSYPLKNKIEIYKLDNDGKKISLFGNDYSDKKVDFPFHLRYQIQDLEIYYQEFLTLFEEMSGKHCLQKLTVFSYFNDTALENMGKFMNCFGTLAGPSLISLSFDEGFFLITDSFLPYLSRSFPNLQHLSLPSNFDLQIEVDQIPPHLRTLILPQTYYPFQPGIFPLSLTSLNIQDYEVRGAIPEGVLPDYLEHLTIDGYYPYKLPLSLPSRLRELCLLGSEFDSEIPNNLLPSTLQLLEFGDNFDRPLPSLPLSLKVLKFSRFSYYDQPIPQGILNEGLEVLHFSFAFNQPLPILPSSLIEIILGTYFNQVIPPRTFPLGLQRLYMGLNFNQKLTKHNLPCLSLTCLSFTEYAHFRKRLPNPCEFPKLTCLCLPRNYHVYGYLKRKILPDSLNTIILFRLFTANKKKGAICSVITKKYQKRCFRVSESCLCSFCTKYMSKFYMGNTATEVNLYF
jgi:FNIP Repeat